ncbi:ribonuclease III [Patescibacteria group bacterium]|nr:ribonuclease III [Patescibacteria group bacterium]
MEIEKLEKKLNLEFKNKDLIKQAFIHRSYINENPGLKLNHNERLEFLGDAVLELIITEHLFNNYPNPEGELTCWRAALVNSRMLSEISNKLGFNDYLLLSKGEQAEQGRARQFILANIIEAVIGAIYLDQGYDKVKEFIDNNILSELKRVLDEKLYIDPKSHFQEQSQSKLGITPNYELIKEDGPDHDKEFQVGVYLEDELIAKGQGPSKQAAQENAAKKALDKKSWN